MAGGGLAARLRRVLAGDDGPGRRGLPINELMAPLPLAALGMLALNDWVLKPSCAPEWLTGKLSDFAGLFVFPLVATALFDLVLLAVAAAGVSVDHTLRRWKLALAIALEVVGFAVLKLWPAGSDALVAVMRIAAPHTEVYLDPTDLLAFVVLPATWWYGRRVLARGAYGRLAWARRGRVAEPFADAVACGADAEVVARVHAALPAWYSGGLAGPVAAALSALRERRG